jgi:hypothetical protein
MPHPTQSPSPHAIASEQFAFERKEFILELHQNARGRVYTIHERIGPLRNRIMLPAAVGGDFLDALRRLAEFEASL